MTAATKVSLFFLLLAALGLTPHRSTASSSSTAPAGVPPPPTARADRFGVYNWNIDDAAFPNDGSTDRLNWGAGKVAELGTRTIRIALTARDIYQVLPNDEQDLVAIAARPAFDKLLRDPRFQTIMLTTYTRGDQKNNWVDGFTPAERAVEVDEIKRLGEYLLSNPAFAGKTFIILNWEGDNAIYYHANKRSTWDYFTDWIRSRAEGVNLARRSYPSSGAHLYSGLEFNALKSPRTGQPCGAPVADPIRNDPLQNRCVIDYVAPRVEVDYYSYSAWYSVDDKLDSPNENLKQRFKSDLGFALAKVKAARPEITESNFIVGEFGFERARYGECNSANYISEMFDAFDGPDAFQVSYSIFWQVVDNAPVYSPDAQLFGLYRPRNGQLGLTLLGETFRKRVAGQTAPNYTGCPYIRRAPPTWGVLNSQGQPNFSLNPDSVISIYVKDCCASTETPFSASGNVVHFDQLWKHYLLPRDNAQWFYESPTQINVSMPLARRTGGARIYVTDANGVDSNGQGINIYCADCPKISGSCAVLEANYQTLRIEPGDVIAISGTQFSLTGNTVVVEQRVTQQTTQRWTLPRANLSLESPTQIKAKLPADSVGGRETLLWVINAQGLESNETTIPLASPCQDCEPRLRPCQPIVNEAGGAFQAGVIATVVGRFAPSGNKVMIEQVDQQNRIYQQTLTQGSLGWSENDQRIRFAIPANIFSGRALIYLISPLGLESRAYEIVIAPSAVTSVSAANYRGPKLAPESIVAAFGSALASGVQYVQTTPLPTELGGTKVIVKDSLGVERNAPLFFVSPTQVNYQLPAGTASGAATITVLSGFGATSIGTVEVVNVAPGLFSADASGKGIAAAIVVRVKADGTQVYEPVAVYDQTLNQFVARPIDLGPPGEQVFLGLFGTGIRGRSSLPAATATIGGLAAPITFAGPQGVFIGLDQINALIPRSLAGRGDVDVTAVIDGQPANVVKVKIK